MLHTQKMEGSALLITLIFLSVVALLTFSASVNSQIQQRMSHQLKVKILADQAADVGVHAFYQWLTHDAAHWNSHSWPTGEWVNADQQSYYTIPESSLVWGIHHVTLNVDGAIINELGAISESNLRVRFRHSIDNSKIYLDHWIELN